MPINHWLTPYMMEASAKTSPIPSTAAAAGFWGSTASPAAAFCRHTQSSTAFSLNLNNEDEEEEPAAMAMEDDGGGESNPNAGDLPKEPLFEKPLTPSDVGKLNRLVIPKQHAEKYFPLNGGGGGGEKGLLLGFEDEIGKSWRFRYSYWNSSQSYVLTKGWSRFVKDKRLDAGDIVLFARHPNDVARLFIGWRRRSSAAAVPQPPCSVADRGGGGWSGLLYAAHPYPTQTDHYPHAESHTKERSGNSKRLRLFGVNLEWDDEGSSSEPSCSGKGSSTGQVEEEPCYQHYSSHSRSGHGVSYVCDSSNI